MSTTWNGQEDGQSSQLLAVGAAPRAVGREAGGGADSEGQVAEERGDLMERDLLSRVAGDGDGVRQRLQGGQDPGPPPSPTLSLRVGCSASAEEPQSRADATIRRAHGHANTVAPSPTSASDRRLAAVVAPGYPMAERRHNLRARDGTGARAQAGGQTHAPRASPAAGSAPQRPPAALAPTLQLAGPAAATGPGEERCDACGLSAQLLRGLASDLDRARAQVALLTCEKESLRYRLKRASAAEAPIASPSTRSHGAGLRCRSCRVRPATVVLAPREHLCLCRRCADAAAACPVCRAAAGAGPAEAAPPR